MWIGLLFRTLETIQRQLLKIYINQNKWFTDLSNYSLALSCAILYQCLIKMFYNVLAKHKVPIDKWTKSDIICALANIGGIYLVLYSSDDSYLDQDTKHYIDYLVCVVIIICWIRCTLYFLMKKSFSILLLTLVEILFDTGAFLICLVCYIFVMASIFTTLYQDILPNNYGNLIVSFRTMFDAGLTVYAYDGMESRVYDHSLLLIFHVYTMNILLLNYLIGILSTTYENMQQSGIFKYKVNLYNYCERYMNAYKEEGLGELVLHPPPVSSLCVLLIPFIFHK